MTAEAPPFWWRQHDWRALLLYPVSTIYGAVAKKRLEAAAPPGAGIPVLCVGNLTVGGSGKTPIAVTIAKAAKKMGLKPGFISRGYGGGMKEPHLADLNEHSVWHSGDEPLLLAAHAPTAVSVNRLSAAKLLIEQGCDFAIMDDGFQSARLRYDFALIVVDSSRGIGNGHVIPGGPLRAPLGPQLRLADGIVVIDHGTAADQVVRQAAQAAKPVYSAKTRIIGPKKFSGNRYLAFSGIGNPAKFFESLRSTGAEIVAKREFGDHHVFTQAELEELASHAARENLQLITTEKDAVRFLNGNAAATEFLSALEVMKISIEFDPVGVAEQVARQTVENFKRRESYR